MTTNWGVRLRKPVRNKVVANSFYKEGCGCGENQLHLAKKCKFGIVFSVVSQTMFKGSSEETDFFGFQNVP